MRLSDLSRSSFDFYLSVLWDVTASLGHFHSAAVHQILDLWLDQAFLPDAWLDDMRRRPMVAGQPSVCFQSFASAPLVGGFLSSGGSTYPDRPIGSQPNSGLASSRFQLSRRHSGRHRASAVQSSGSPGLAISSPSAHSSGSPSSGRSRPVPTGLGTVSADPPSQHGARMVSQVASCVVS